MGSIDVKESSGFLQTSLALKNNLKLNIFDRKWHMLQIFPFFTTDLALISALYARWRS